VLKAQKLACPIKEIGKLMFGWSDQMVEGIGYDREQQIEELGMSVRQFFQGTAFLQELAYRLKSLVCQYASSCKNAVPCSNIIFLKYFQHMEKK
jgi:hypothetical protein